MAKQYYIDGHISICYPYEASKSIKSDTYGVLAEYVEKRMSRRGIDKIICEMIMRHPYVPGSMSLGIRVMWEDNSGRITGYYHTFDFQNDNYNKQQRTEKSIRYEI